MRWEKAVSSDDLGKDLRSVKDLLHKHQVNNFCKGSFTAQHVVLFIANILCERKLVIFQVLKGLSSNF